MCGADGADGDASEAVRRGGALFIERPLQLPLLAPPSLASSTSCAAFRQGIGRRESCRAGAWFAFAYLVADVRSYHS